MRFLRPLDSTEPQSIRILWQCFFVSAGSGKAGVTAHFLYLIKALVYLHDKPPGFPVAAWRVSLLYRIYLYYDEQINSTVNCTSICPMWFSVLLCFFFFYDVYHSRARLPRVLVYSFRYTPACVLQFPFETLDFPRFRWASQIPAERFMRDAWEARGHCALSKPYVII